MRSLYFPFFLYIAVAVAGYLSLGSQVPDLVIARDPLPGSSDVLMSIGQMGLFIGLTISLSLRILANKDNIMGVIGNKNKASENYEQVDGQEPSGEGQVSKTRERISYAVSGFVPYVFSLFINNQINSYISFISSFTCPVFIIIMPSLMNLKLREQFQLGSGSICLIYAYLALFAVLLIMAIIVNIKNFSTG